MLKKVDGLKGRLFFVKTTIIQKINKIPHSTDEDVKNKKTKSLLKSLRKRTA